MTLPRKSLISLGDTPFYHCMSRCVRRAFLCGTDHYSGKCYEHRRDWLEGLLLKNADIFAIKLCAYAVMSNHYHVVLHVRPDIAAAWSDEDIVKRWHQLFNGNLFSQRFLNGEPMHKAEWLTLKKDIDLWRSRLMDISWFMRVVNERVARRANIEDKCTGRFWEGRFKSQALLDERALLSCMAYVDLNPIRAKIAKTPESSDFTSIKKRIDAISQSTKHTSNLEQFVDIQEKVIGIPFSEADYFDLVDWSGRAIRKDKRGSINKHLPPILERLGLSADNWKVLTTQFETQFGHWVGSEHIVRQVCEDKAYQRIPSTKPHRRLLSVSAK